MFIDKKETNSFSEIKAFSEFQDSEIFQKSLRQGSVSDEDAKSRIKTYGQSMAIFEDFRQTAEDIKVFSAGIGQIPILTRGMFEASIQAWVKSWAGLLSIERAFDAPEAFAWFLDIYNLAGSLIMPNVGPDNLSGLGNLVKYSTPLAVGQLSYQYLSTRKITPFSVKITVARVGLPTITITDDGQGNLLAPAGVLDTGSQVNYSTGAFTVVFTAGFTPIVTDILSLTAGEDAPGTSDDTGGIAINKFTLDSGRVAVRTYEELLLAESNLIKMAQTKKSLGTDVNEYLVSRLVDIYTKLLNYRLTDTIKSNYTGATFNIGLTAGIAGYHTYDSELYYFNGKLAEIDKALALRSYKTASASCYLVGTTIGTEMQKCKAIKTFEKVDSAYVNDLIGYMNGVPVLQSADLSAEEGFAIHKTPGGEIAPVARGIYLPITNLPTVGNSKNPSQIVNGIYYQEGHSIITDKLVQRFTLN